VTRPPVLLGVNVDPSAARAAEALERARMADELGLDLLTIQDHPYNPGFLDTWTLLAALGAATRRVGLGTNVLCTPLRPPAMLAKQAASLDVLTGGRLELGLGAGAFLDGIRGFGVEPGDRFRAFREALEVIRGTWEAASEGTTFSYEGTVHRVPGVRPGPPPAHRIRIWVGAGGPSMLRLAGRAADGILLSNAYVPPERLDSLQALVDQGASRAGRPPEAVRRGYNLMGVLDLGRGPTVRPSRPGLLAGPPGRWVEEIVRLYREHRQDTFIFWPVAGPELAQVERFAREVAPAVRELLGGGRG
jgi:alkanesulfonate monooxygenase SsuD/methylene tetrahydromethanopterin reductase-like flavin-dependent oxidoreductase (luciferase family)